MGKVNVVQKLVPFKLKRSAIRTWIAKVPLSKIKEQLGRLHHHGHHHHQVLKLLVLKMTDSRYLWNLVESMPRTPQEVIRREEGHTKC